MQNLQSYSGSKNVIFLKFHVASLIMNVHLMKQHAEEHAPSKPQPFIEFTDFIWNI